ncbi:Ldh family oxidoreductase [Sinorhizobium psoraleae]|uniref:Ldh family oxidoreductase n=1 Tax=Sinorhizobium psoraleae TaxID=520838 RepID=A0ABT4KR07_9HYPH|nr:Ldh family oxidoreductase [Sinorhizobium psoraleae]MCZ4094364.1 Ldh family oxidoreductase [Sinorhizobium psoraleae]
MTTVETSRETIEAVCVSVLTGHGATVDNARPVARAIARAEADGNRVCGLYYLPIFCRHLTVGKVDGEAVPDVTTRGATVAVDARYGFAHPAIAAGMPALIGAARRAGVAAMAVRNSYNCLALGHHVLPLADAGLIGICVSNAPASVAPPGATRALFGTNPLAFAVPSKEGAPPIVVDQSMSAVTKTEMILRRNRGEAIPTGWAQDKHGQPTTDAATGLEGSLLPAGGRKGANIALLVEILAAALTGAALSTEASAFGNDEGGPPRVGQFLIAIDPDHFSAGHFCEAVDGLMAAHEAAGVRLPGHSGRKQAVCVDADLWQAALRLSKPEGAQESQSN